MKWLSVFLLIWLASTGVAQAQAQASSDEGLRLVEAVQVTLARNQVIQQQSAQVAHQEGVRLTTQGAFETQLATTVTHGRDRAPLTALQRAQFEGIFETITDATAYQLSLQRQFRSGLTMRPSLTVTRSRLALGGTLDPVDQPVFLANNLARFEVLATQPLLKGRGGTSVAAGERAADLGVGAMQRQRDYVASAQVLETILAYWQYVAVTRHLTILAGSEARAVRLLDEAERLVAADRRPRADLDQLRADRADKEATRLLAEQAVYAARQHLGRAMGLTKAESLRLAPPANDFSVLPDASALATLDRPGFQVRALEQRADLAAQRHAREAAQVLTRAARRDRQHRLDLSLALGYTGLDDGRQLEQFFTPVVSNIGGLNFSAALRYELPFSNRRAQGTYAQAQADRTAEEVREADLRRQIALAVDLALQDLTASVDVLARIEEAVGYHRKALENERARFQQNFSTLFNVILFQDRLTLAETNRIQAQNRVAAAMTRLRFETGMLPHADARPETLTLNALVNLPDIR